MPRQPLNGTRRGSHQTGRHWITTAAIRTYERGLYARDTRSRALAASRNAPARSSSWSAAMAAGNNSTHPGPVTPGREEEDDDDDSAATQTHAGRRVPWIILTKSTGFGSCTHWIPRYARPALHDLRSLPALADRRIRGRKREAGSGQAAVNCIARLPCIGRRLAVMHAAVYSALS
jgi:hypothetical protein